MKIWIDVLTPKQANFFAPLVKRLMQRGSEVVVTTRKYREVNQMLRIRKISAIVVGRHGGATLKNKLISSVERMKNLAEILSSSRCDLAVSFASPEAARVSYGLSIPHCCISDSPHAEAVSRLTVPLSRILFTPKAVPNSAWTQYGIEADKVIRYNALDPVAWLRHFRPNPSVLNELGLDISKPIIVLRPEETQASYLLRHISKSSLSILIARALKRSIPNSQIVLIPRYDLAHFTEKLAGKSAIVPSSAIDGSSLLHYSNLFLGGGGTMTAEAALLGVPAVSFYPAAATYVERYLTKLHLVVRVGSVRSIVKFALRVMNNPAFSEAFKARSKRIMSCMENPISVIEKHLE